jgi:integrase
MSYLSPQTLTRAETQALLAASKGHVREHLLFSLALGTGLRLSELVGLNVADLFFPNGTPRVRVRVRPEIAKRGRSGKDGRNLTAAFFGRQAVRCIERIWHCRPPIGCAHNGLRSAASSLSGRV